MGTVSKWIKEIKVLAVRKVRHVETIRRVQDSVHLIYDTIHGNSEAVAAQIERIHSK